MKNCDRCGSLVEDDEVICPHCHKKTKKQSPVLMFGAVFFGICFILICISRITGPLNRNSDDNYTEERAVSDYVRPEDAPAETTDASSIKILNHYKSQNKLGEDILVVEYEYHNGEDQPKAFIWAYDDRAFQNGVECMQSLFADEVENSISSNQIQPGYTVTVKRAYQLNESSDVQIIVKPYLRDNAIIDTKVKPE